MREWTKLIYLISIGLFWGAGFMFIKVCLDGNMSPLTLTNLRCFCSGFLCLLLAQTRKVPWVMPPLKTIILIAIFTNAIPFTLCSYGEIYSNSATAGVLEGLIPLFTILLGPVLIKGVIIQRNQFFGVLLGLSGIIIMFLTSYYDMVEGNALGRLLLTLMSLSFGVGFILGEKHLMKYDPIQLSSLQHIISGILLIPFTYLFENPMDAIHLSYSTWLSLLSLCMVSSLGWVFYYTLLKKSSASFVSISTYICPVVAIFLGRMFLDESLAWNVYLGATIIFMSVFILNRSNSQIPNPGAHPR
ncbi:MAG TPA: DMT family transporter [Gammaproteobacteria bacterium]|nr:DMT family transporter [Gammaproteobacteria bacterium]